MLANDQQDIVVKFTAFDNKILDKTVNYVILSIKRVGGQFSGPIFLPNKIRKITLNTSPHVDKRSQEQFELTSHKRMIVIRKASVGVVDSLSKLELSPGIDVKVEVVSGSEAAS